MSSTSSGAAHFVKPRPDLEYFFRAVSMMRVILKLRTHQNKANVCRYSGNKCQFLGHTGLHENRTIFFLVHDVGIVNNYLWKFYPLGIVPKLQCCIFTNAPNAQRNFSERVFNKPFILYRHYKFSKIEAILRTQEPAFNVEGDPGSVGPLPSEPKEYPNPTPNHGEQLESRDYHVCQTFGGFIHF